MLLLDPYLLGNLENFDFEHGSTFITSNFYNIAIIYYYYSNYILITDRYNLLYK